MDITINQKRASEIFLAGNAFDSGDNVCGGNHSDCPFDINGMKHLGAQVLHSNNRNEVAAYRCTYIYCNGTAVDLTHIVGYGRGVKQVTIRTDLLNE